MAKWENERVNQRDVHPYMHTYTDVCVCVRGGQEDKYLNVYRTIELNSA